jgi:hypothetical protein
MRRSLRWLLPALLASLTVTAGALAAGDGAGWENIRNDGGISVSRKVVPGSPFVAFRGEGDVNAPLLAVADVLADVPHETEWMDSVREARILRKVSDTEYIMYSHLGTPPTLTDRDLVADVRISIDNAGHTLTVTMQSVDDALAPHTDYVRAQITESRFTLRANPDGSSTHVLAEIHCDPRGNLPGWVVNFVQRSWGYNTIQALRRQVAAGHAPENPLLRQALASR